MRTMQSQAFHRLVAIFVAMTVWADRACAAESPEKAKIVQECAESAVLMARRLDNLVLDYSEESLELAERLILKLRRGSLTPENEDTVVLAFGCYVGEVFVRHLGGVWYFPDEKESAVIGPSAVVKLPKGNLSNPNGRVFKLMAFGAEYSIVGLYRWTKEQLARPAALPTPAN